MSDLSGLCAEAAAMPTGSPLYAHVAVEGTSTTCSNQEAPLRFVSKTGVDCPTP